jgi:magnesium chelatase accessory protein
MSARRLIWEKDGRDWPNRDSSQFVQAAGLRWHVQVMGAGPDVLLIHGTGATTHSWRDFAPLLSRQFRTIAPDLPGHGFTDPPRLGGLSLEGMADAVAALLRTLGSEPALVVGHSAGAAILARMCLDGAIRPHALISLNGALTPFRGIGGKVFSPIAKLLALTGLPSRLFARRAENTEVIKQLVRNTGSRLDQRGVELYGRLARNPGHVAAALGMMANWDLERLERQLPGLPTELLLVAGSADRAIPAAESFRLRDTVPRAQVELLRGLGHLAHEERPEEVADIVFRTAASAGLNLHESAPEAAS